VTFTAFGHSTKAYHGYLVTTDPSGSRRYYRGGPTALGFPLPYGRIKSQYGSYDQHSPDWGTGTPPSRTYIDNGESCTCYDKTLGRAMNDVTAANIPYDPTGPNSNTTASYGLERLGLDPGVPPVLAPGWGEPLLP